MFIPTLKFQSKTQKQSTQKQVQSQWLRGDIIIGSNNTLLKDVAKTPANINLPNFDRPGTLPPIQLTTLLTRDNLVNNSYLFKFIKSNLMLPLYALV